MALCRYVTHPCVSGVISETRRLTSIPARCGSCRGRCAPCWLCAAPRGGHRSLSFPNEGEASSADASRKRQATSAASDQRDSAAAEQGEAAAALVAKRAKLDKQPQEAQRKEELANERDALQRLSGAGPDFGLASRCVWFGLLVCFRAAPPRCIAGAHALPSRSGR